MEMVVIMSLFRNLRFLHELHVHVMCRSLCVSVPVDSLDLQIYM